MKQILSLEEVKKAMETLVAQGKKPTLAALHSLLDHRGSMSTLVRLKSEIDNGLPQARDSEEGLKAFRTVWTLAADEGRRTGEAIISNLRDNLSVLAVENERLDGALAAAEARNGELAEAKSSAESELREFRLAAEKDLHLARTTSAEASAKAASVLERLSDAQAKHTAEVNRLQSEVSAERQRAHEFELRFVRAQALLEAKAIITDKQTADASQGN
jgi:hypothetical protein